MAKEDQSSEHENPQTHEPTSQVSETNRPQSVYIQNSDDKPISKKEKG